MLSDYPASCAAGQAACPREMKNSIANAHKKGTSHEIHAQKNI